MSDHTLHAVSCPCPKSCRRKGLCDACKAHHAGKKNPPYCERPKKK